MPDLNFPPGYRIGEHDEYQIIQREPISEGVNNTFAEVYLVKKIKVRKKFALKVLKPEVIERFSRTVEDFQEEIKVLMELNHKNIVKIDDYGILKDKDDVPSFYLIMEYIDDASLVKEKYSLRKMFIFFLQILDGLTYLHDKEILHRDIKPDNILLENDSIVKLTDFGVAKTLAEEDTVSSVIGAPAYAPPEQLVKKGRLTFASDIYAAGKTFYTMLTRSLPEVNKQIQSLPENLAEHTWHDPVLGILKKATEDDPKNRYQTAAEMRKAVFDVFSEYFAAKPMTKDTETGTKKEKKEKSGNHKKGIFAALILVIISMGFIYSGFNVGNYVDTLFINFYDFQTEYENALAMYHDTTFSDAEIAYTFKRLSHHKDVTGEALEYAYQAALKNKELEQSLAYLEKAVAKYPQNINYKKMLGEERFKQGLFMSARDIWKEAALQAPDDLELKKFLDPSYKFDKR